MEYTLYCDESVSTDRIFGDFFGGCIVNNNDLVNVVEALERAKTELHLFGEIKWTKMTDQYLEKYASIMHLFFSFVRSGQVRVRIMFRCMKDQYIGPSSLKDDKYFKLYYQFIKHSFGFMYTNGYAPFYVRIYLDQLPNKRERCAEFKSFLKQMPDTTAFKQSSLRIREDQIAEVRSHDHVLLQCTDIVLGAMQFRLNKHHLDKPIGKSRRGKKTIAKEKLYKLILDEICSIHPHFNIGESTGARGMQNPHWESPYEHWRFVPNESERPASSTSIPHVGT